MGARRQDGIRKLAAVLVGEEGMNAFMAQLSEFDVDQDHCLDFEECEPRGAGSLSLTMCAAFFLSKSHVV